jgi:hypothetical protein
MSLPRFLTLALGLSLIALCAGCFSSKKDKGPTVVVRFMIEATERESGGTVRLPRSGTVISVAPKSLFTEYDVENCDVAENELGKCLVFRFTSQAGRDLYRMTATNQGKRLITVINGVALGAKRIESPFSDGYVVTYVEVEDAELETMAKDITRTSKNARKEMEKKG